MTSNPPDEAIHVRGKTLTPESPRPLHIPEPSSIPVLQHQMDPVFNDTSTYEKPKSSPDGASPYNASPREGTAVAIMMAGEALVNGRTSLEVDGQFPSGTMPAEESRSRDQMDISMSTTTSSPSLSPPSPSPSHASASVSTSAFISASSSSASPVPLAGTETSSAPRDAAHSGREVPPADPAPFLESPTIARNPPGAPSGARDSVLSLPLHPSPPSPGRGMNGVDGTDGSSHPLPDRPHRPESPNANTEVGVDFQNLLDNLSPPISTAPSGLVVITTTASPRAFPVPVGLPPRPPPQEKPPGPLTFPPSEDIRSYHQFPAQSASAASYVSQQHLQQQQQQQLQQLQHPGHYHPSHPSHPNPGLPPLQQAAPGAAPGTSAGANGLPPPPVATFQQPPVQPPTAKPQVPSNSSGHKNSRSEKHATKQLHADDEAPWGPDVQKKYDEFLHDERVNVTQGLWDRFPPDSRLFVGNLPTERVTKRDLFHVFHKYGKLAQISIKQAYGFIQFLDAAACYQALQAEQGGVIRGRKIHLEISKPQRNSRQAPPVAEPPRTTTARRSRSPDYGRSGAGGRTLRVQVDRYERVYEAGRPPFSDFRDEPTARRRDDYRPPRSPSPRGFRGREEYRTRDRSPERFDRPRRSRSPYPRGRRHRTPPSPRARVSYDSDSDLPFPRRVPRDVPDVQILVLDDVDRNFIYHVEGTLKSRSLRVDVSALTPRISLSAMIRRQIIEGVLAVIKVSRNHQYSGKIQLQVFDRSGGPDNVRTNDYSDLDLNVAAEVVIHAQSMQRSGAPPSYPPNSSLGAPPFPPPQPPQPPQPPVVPPIPAIPALSNPSQLTNIVSTLDGPTLQSLLGALQQQPSAQPNQQSFPPATANNPVDLASLLSNTTRHLNPASAVPVVPGQPLPAQPLGLQVPKPSIIPDPNLMSLLAKGLGGQGQAAVGSHVQNIVNQFAKWKH